MSGEPEQDRDRAAEGDEGGFTVEDGVVRPRGSAYPNPASQRPSDEPGATEPVQDEPDGRADEG